MIFWENWLRSSCWKSTYLRLVFTKNFFSNLVLHLCFLVTLSNTIFWKNQTNYLLKVAKQLIKKSKIDWVIKFLKTQAHVQIFSRMVTRFTSILNLATPFLFLLLMIIYVKWAGLTWIHNIISYTPTHLL